MKVMRVYPAKPADVYLYATCLVDLFDPVAGLDAIALIEREGIRVHFVEKQTCCGQPAYTSGHEEEARKVAQSQMALFPEPWPVVVLSGSCGGMMHHHYARLFPESREVAAFCERVFELTEFLAQVCRVRWYGVGRASIGARCRYTAGPAPCWVSSMGSPCMNKPTRASAAALAAPSRCAIPTSARPWWRTRPATCWPPAPTPW